MEKVAEVSIDNKINEELKDAIILIVDDSEFSLMTLKEIFRSYGFENLHFAKNGLEAIEKTNIICPDIVILDMVMPELDGFGYCKRIRKKEIFKHIPILVQTALTISEDKKEIFRCGATDYITKPVDADELIARTLVNLERITLLKEMQKNRQRVEFELEEARKMQDLIVPSGKLIDDIKSDYNISIDSLFEASSELGGDFWGVYKLSEDMLGLYIVDFSGHGIAAALNTFRLHSVMELNDKYKTDPAKFLNSLNKKLHSLLSVEQFATMFYGVIDFSSNTLKFSAAASPSPFFWDAKKSKGTLLKSDGFPLGIVKDAKYVNKELPFSKGDALLVYSDALTETEDKDGGVFDEKSLLDFCNAKCKSSKDGGKVFRGLVNHFKKNYYSNVSDDLTINMYSRDK